MTITPITIVQHLQASYGQQNFFAVKVVHLVEPYSHSLGREPAREWTTKVCNAWPVRRQTYGCLPSRSSPLGLYKFILLGKQRHKCVNNLPQVVTWKLNGQDHELVIVQSQVRSPNHYTITPHFLHYPTVNKELRVCITAPRSKCSVAVNVSVYVFVCEHISEITCPIFKKILLFAPLAAFRYVMNHVYVNLNPY